GADAHLESFLQLVTGGGELELPDERSVIGKALSRVHRVRRGVRLELELGGVLAVRVRMAQRLGSEAGSATAGDDGLVIAVRQSGNVAWRSAVPAAPPGACSARRG